MMSGAGHIDGADAGDAILSAASAARAFRAAGEDDAAAPLLVRVRAFADRNRAPGLPTLATPVEGPPALLAPTG
jgi:hypothetical protein